MQRVLVTGATGFVGNHLATELLNQGNEVHLLVRPGSSRSRIYNLPGDPETHPYDGTTGGVLSIVARVRPDVVYHLAACAINDHHSEDISRLINANILLGTQLLQALSESAGSRFINAGTYFQHYQSRPYSPVSLYAATKQAFEDILQFYTETNAVSAITLTLFDTYGPNDPRPKLFNLLQRASKENVPIAMSQGGQLLDLVYVSDVVRAFLRAAELLKTGGVTFSGHSFCVNSGQSLPLKEVVRIYEQVTGQHLKIDWGARGYRPREVMSPWKGETLPGWRAMVDLETGIRLTV